MSQELMSQDLTPPPWDINKQGVINLGPNCGPSYGCGGGPKAGWRYLDRVSRLSTLGPHVLWQSGPSVHTLGVQPAEGWAATNSSRGALAGPLS